jgi:hypothetical protein
MLLVRRQLFVEARRTRAFVSALRSKMTLSFALRLENDTNVARLGCSRRIPRISGAGLVGFAVDHFDVEFGGA